MMSRTARYGFMCLHRYYGGRQTCPPEPGSSLAPWNLSQRVMFSLGPQAEKFELKMDVTCRTPEDAVVLKNQLEGITKLLQSLIAREKQTPSVATSAAF